LSVGQRQIAGDNVDRRLARGDGRVELGLRADIDGENRGRHDSQRQAKACAHQRTARQKRTARAQPRGPSACARDIAAALAQRERIHCWISE